MVTETTLPPSLGESSSTESSKNKMPWKAQSCPFCHIQYANKKGLINHLLKYTGEWRIPADGIHDVLKITGLSIMKAHFPAEQISYRCPSCSNAISDQRKFIEHVVYRQHYDGGKKDGHPFDPEPYKIWRPKGAFPFLRLPLELREIVYEAILCFDRIEVCGGVRETYVDPVKGIRLQHNPSRNLLALLAVSSQVYHEARRIFYFYNTFVFHSKEALPVFLIGIGTENASLLRSVEWKGDNDLYENHIDIIKSCIRQTNAQGKEVNIWNDEDQFVDLLKMIRSPEPLYRCSTYRLLRLDADDVSAGDANYRYTFTIHFYENGGAKRDGKATYELCTRAVKDDDPIRIAALQALMDKSLNGKKTGRQ